MLSVRDLRIARAKVSCRYPVASIAATTRSRVAGSTFRVPFSTWDTVEIDTCAIRATSTIVAMRPPVIEAMSPQRVAQIYMMMSASART